MSFGVTKTTNGIKSIPLGSKITKTLPIKSASVMGGPTNATENKDVLGNLMYAGIKSHALDQNIMSNNLSVRGVLPCQPAYNSIRVLRTPPVKIRTVIRYRLVLHETNVLADCLGYQFSRLYLFHGPTMRKKKNNYYISFYQDNETV